MNLLSSMRIGPRLTAAFGVVIAFVLAIAAVGWLSILSIDDSLDVVATDAYAKVKLANEILAGVDKQARATRNALLYETPAERKLNWRRPTGHAGPWPTPTRSSSRACAASRDAPNWRRCCACGPPT